MSNNTTGAIGVLTSGGDAPGMNAALRAVVRTALSRGVEVFAIYEGYQGMVDGGDRLRSMTWDQVSGIMQQGGTIIGTARCAAFRTRAGRLQAALHLLQRGIDRLVVIGGDGSLTGAAMFRQEWPELVAELAGSGAIMPETAAQHPQLAIVGLVGSIDNDFHGTDMTIGADTALHRITTALDQIGSTAASHQRTFVVEVMGRHCGYLALMSALAGTAHWVFLPENPPASDDWETEMCEVLAAGRAAGRRHSTVIVAEGACDRNGNPITSERVRQVLEEHLKEDVRVSILGHIQRGGAPSAFDRWMSTLVGHAAVEHLLASAPTDEPQVIGMRYNRITHLPLAECVAKTRSVPEAVAARDYERAMGLRGASFKEQFRTLQTLIQTVPRPPRPGQRRLRFGVLTAGAPAPGMNIAVRAAVRLAIDRGHIPVAISHGFEGLVEGQTRDFTWMDVHGWGSMGGSNLGTSRAVPAGQDFAAIAETLRAQKIEALLLIGGWSAYEAARQLYQRRAEYPAFNIPVICLPASISNNLPGSELCIGADTALNNIVEVVDKIKQSGMAARRCFVVEVMGGYCGYLGLMSGLATGAERVYLHEEGVTLRTLQEDLVHMTESFKRGRRLSLLIRNERANPLYTTAFMSALFEEESHGLFDVRQAILGHLQQGGDPSPFDRIQATRLASHSVDFLVGEAERGATTSAVIGILGGRIQITDLVNISGLMDLEHVRPKNPWWLELRPVVQLLSRSEG